MSLREIFIKEYYNEIYYEAATLCKSHHMRLHSIYGKRPKLVTALKQQRWVKIQREKKWHGMTDYFGIQREEKLNPAQSPLYALDEGTDS